MALEMTLCFSDSPYPTDLTAPPRPLLVPIALFQPMEYFLRVLKCLNF